MNKEEIKKEAERVIELFEYPNILSGLMSSEVKQCALICIDEIMKIKGYSGNILIDNETYILLDDIEKINWDYWQEVKEYIEKNY